MYEQARELKEVGAGVSVAPNLARLLRELGVLARLSAQAVCLDVGWEFRRWEDGTVLSAEDLRESCEALYGERTYTAHRADLLAALGSAVPAGSVRLGMRCVSVEAGSPAVLRFADGSRAEADVVIGADGVHSVVRAALAEAAAPVYSGICAFRALVPAAQAPALARRPAQTLWLGPGHHLVHYPIAAGTLVNLVAIAPAGDHSVESWSATATVEELLAEFEGWDARLVDLIRAAGTPGTLGAAGPRPAEALEPPARSPSSATRRTRCSPSSARARPSRSRTPPCWPGAWRASPIPVEALRRYEALRLPRTTRLQEVSHGRAHVNHLPDGPEQRARDAAFADADPLRDNGWIYGYDASGA